MLNINFGLGRKRKTATSEFQTQYTGNWVWRAVAALVDDDRYYDPLEISKKINAAETEIANALSGLQKLGIIQRTPQGYKRILKLTYFSDKNLEPTKLVSDHISISKRILALMEATSPENLFYRTSFVGSTEKKFKDFCSKVERAMRELILESSQSPVENVYSISLSCIDLVSRDESELQDDK